MANQKGLLDYIVQPSEDFLKGFTENPSDVPTEGPTGFEQIGNAVANSPVGEGAKLLGGGLAGFGAGKILGKGLAKVGKGVSGFGDSMVTKGLNLTPKMTADAQKAMGEKSLSDFLAKRGLHGANYDQLSAYAEPIQQEFDSIANNPNIKINTHDVVQSFADKIDELNKSILPADHERANSLQKIGLNFIDKYGHLPQMGADAVTSLRRNVDAHVRDFAAIPQISSPARIARNILQESVRSADPTGNLQDLGNELRKVYTLTEKSEPRQFASAPGLSYPTGMSDLINTTLGNIFGGPVGAGVAAVGGRLMRTNPGIKTIGALTRGTGAAIQGVGKTLPLISGALGAGIVHNMGNNGQNQKNEQNPSHMNDGSINPEQNPTDILQDSARDKNGHWQAPQDLKNLTIPGDDPSWTQDRYLQEAGQLVNNPNSAAQLDKKWGQIYSNRQNWLSSHTPNGMQDFVTNYPVELNQMNALHDILQKYSGATGIQNFSDLIKYAESQKDPQVAVAFGMMANNQAAQTHETLGRVTNFDINYLNNFPKPTDNLNTALAKLDRFAKTNADNYRQYKPIYDYSLANGTSMTPTPAPQNQPAGQLPPMQQQAQPQSAQLPSIPPGFQSLSGL